MKFDLENLNPGTWFSLEDGGKVCLRICAGDDYRNIRKQVAKKKIEFRNGQRFEYQEVNDDLLNQLLWDFCIVSWENLFDGNEKPIPCTKENKFLLMGRSIRFSNFVSECLDQITQSQKARDEDAAKN